ncbi:MAG: NADH:ubiquinone reductase (Na(+)-transporting) subunit C [Vicingaceae bacterium]
MAINRDSNVYTIVFATIMVVIVGGLLAFIASSLKPMQQANVKNEKMQNILQSIGIEETDGVTREEAGAKFNEFIVRRITINYDGEILSDKTAEDAIDPQDKLDAFNIDLRKEYSRYVKPIMSKHKGDDEAISAALSASEDIHFPIFVCENNGKKYYVVSASGKGLWDDVWGYIGLNQDAESINGSVFDHKGETAGLGSKINETWFEKQFVGKTIAENGKFYPVTVEKPGKDLDNHQVDGISGATFSCVGVNEMLERNLEVYYNFFKGNPDFSGASDANSANNVVEENDAVATETEEADSNTVVMELLPLNEGFDNFVNSFESLADGTSQSFIITGVKFSAGSANINKKSSTETLEKIVKGLTALEHAQVELSGHTDNAGEEEVLMNLSKNRAESVKAYLVENGIDEARITTAGYGSSQPLVSNDTQEGKDKNKRTEIRITK